MRQTAWQDEDLFGLEAIGRQIAKKCAGLPLLARSLGFLLSQHKSTEAWEDIRDKKIILGMNEDIQLQEPLERLMLSYYYMPLKFKLCFTYCAVFPKGFTITSDHLIQQWRALGYIQAIDGKYCVHYLLGMSFLQISKTSQVSRIISFPFLGSCDMVQCYRDVKIPRLPAVYVSTYLATNWVVRWSYTTVITTLV
jgi:hypothetical protein